MTDTPREQADVTREPTGGQSCRVVVDGDEDESYLVCLACDPGREVCCGHHRAPHDESGCRATIGVNPSIKCACTRREPTGGQGLREELTNRIAGMIGRWYPQASSYDGGALLAEHIVLGPLAALIADAERVRRVREVANEMDAELEARGFILDRCIRPGGRLRRALDGEPQP